MPRQRAAIEVFPFAHCVRSHSVLSELFPFPRCVRSHCVLIGRRLVGFEVGGLFFSGRRRYFVL